MLPSLEPGQRGSGMGDGVGLQKLLRWYYLGGVGVGPHCWCPAGRSANGPAGAVTPVRNSSMVPVATRWAATVPSRVPPNAIPPVYGASVGRMPSRIRFPASGYMTCAFVA